MTTHLHSWAALALCAALAGAGAASAQEKATKLPTPRLAPIPTGSGAIPAGADGGTPASSDSLQLGTPVTPANDADRDALRTQSAAARAAARGKAPLAAASSSGCARPAIAAASSAGRGSAATRTPAGPGGLTRGPVESPPPSMARGSRPADCG